MRGGRKATRAGLPKVITDRTGHSRSYQSYPYGNYAQEQNSSLLFPIGEMDFRRPPKERILGIPDGTGGVAFSFGELDDDVTP